jgi:hypothetical protein
MYIYGSIFNYFDEKYGLIESGPGSAYGYAFALA